MANRLGDNRNIRRGSFSVKLKLIMQMTALFLLLPKIYLSKMLFLKAQRLHSYHKSIKHLNLQQLSSQSEGKCYICFKN